MILSSYYRDTWHTFQPKLEKKINSLEKKFLYFVKKIFSYILQNRTF